jgi:dTDP-4-dehydrorhamnose reductase
MEEDPTGPINYYGETKLEGEKIAMKLCQKTMIFRTSWLYSPHGQNFVKTMFRIAKEKDSLNIVYDQTGTPTYAHDLADILMKTIAMMKSGNLQKENFRGIYHYSNEGIASWFDFAKAVFELRNMKVMLHPVLTEQFPTPARRPRYTVLDKSKIRKTLGIEIPHWRDSLLKCISSMDL